MWPVPVVVDDDDDEEEEEERDNQQIWLILKPRHGPVLKLLVFPAVIDHFLVNLCSFFSMDISASSYKWADPSLPLFDKFSRNWCQPNTPNLGFSHTHREPTQFVEGNEREDCVIFHRGRSMIRTYCLDDVFCREQRSVVCERCKYLIFSSYQSDVFFCSRICCCQIQWTSTYVEYPYDQCQFTFDFISSHSRIVFNEYIKI